MNNESIVCAILQTEIALDLMWNVLEAITTKHEIRKRGNRIFVAYKNIPATRTLGQIDRNLKASKNNYVAAKFMRRRYAGG